MNRPEADTRLAALSEAKRALLAKRLRGAASGAPVATIPASERRLGEHPASYAQQRLWFVEQLAAGRAGYCIPAAVRLRGALDVAALERALTRVLERHDALRTTFRTRRQGGVDELIQVVASPGDATISIVDLRGEGAAAQRAHVASLVDENADSPFDLEAGPLVRARLVRVGEDESILLIAMHHIVSDGWSVAVLIRELACFYAVARDGKKPQLGELAVQYADYTRWQGERLSGARLAQLADFWRNHLEGAPPVLAFPAARERPATRNPSGASVSAELDASQLARLKECARAHDATLFMVLFAAYATLLSRYAGQSDVTIGTPVANRERPELEGLIGLFVNTLPMRVDLSGEPSFSEVIARTRAVVLAAFAHQDMPFDKLVELVRPERSLQHHPLFQAMFALQNTPSEAMRLDGLELTPIAVPTRTAKFDLTLSAEETGQGLALYLEYSHDLLGAREAERTLAHYVALVDALVSEPGRAVDQAPFVGAAERAGLLARLSTPSLAYDRELCAHDLVEAQVARTPEATAVVDSAERLSYRELDTRAERVARALERLGVGPGALVALALERTSAVPVAILGVWKAGGAYAPVDPEYPRARVDAMLSLAQAPIVLTQSSLYERFAGTASHVVCIEDVLSGSEDLGGARRRRVKASDLSHVIFTSGSTGAPKGVAIAHASTVARLHWARERFSAAELSGVLASTSLSFDLSVFELWGPLSWGGKVIVARNVLEYPTLAARGEVRLINTVPSAMAEVARACDLEGVLTVNVAGEALPRTVVEAVYAKPTVERVLNLYGPSEDTTYSTEEVVPRVEGRRPAIGRPLPGTRVYILDAHREPVPAGVVGEIYIGGEGLALGYLNRPDLTEERFVADPFVSGGRMYRTGDLGRLLEDGERIDYVGRADHQVKIRGFRIELGDIENALRKHPAVKDVVVVADREAAAGPRIVAYASRHEGVAGDESALRAHLGALLPAYMIPWAIVLLDRMPLSPNGKIDRKQLPEPPRAAREEERPFVAPRSTTEQVLVTIFRELLLVDQVSVDDDFFTLGGHSLKLLSLAAAIEEKLGRKLSVARLYEAPTVERLAALVGAPGEAGPEPLVRLRGNGTEPAIYLVHPASGNAMVYQPLADALDGQLSVYGLHAPSLESDELTTSVPEIAARYVAAIRAAQPHGPYSLGGWSLGGVIAFEMACQLQAAGEEIALLAALDTWAPIAANASAYADLDETDLLAELAVDYEIPVDAAELRRAPREERVPLLLERARGGRGLPAGLGVRDVERFLRTFHLHLALVRSYEPKAYGGPLVLFRAEQTLRESPEAHADLGWGGLCIGGALARETPGTHRTLVQSPNVTQLATALRASVSPTRTF